MTRRRILPLMLALVAALAGPATAGAQTPGDTPPAPDAPDVAPDATRRLAEQVAGRWGVPVDAIRVEWGAGPAVAAGGAIRLLGSGAGGSFVAEVRGERTVRRRVRVGVERSVVVAARDLIRGATLAAADMTRRDTVIWGAAQGAEVEPGWLVQRRIPAGSVLSAPAVSPPPAVVAGHPVTLVWRGRGLRVTTRAVAAGTAARGERVTVRTETGRRIWGIAESADLVRIGGIER